MRVPANAHGALRGRGQAPGGLSRGNYYLAACTPSGPAGSRLRDLGEGHPRSRAARRSVARPCSCPRPRPARKAAQAEDCGSGAHTLAQPGDRVYPDIGNGGYASVHSDVFINYDALTNLFLPGTHVDLQQRSTQCLSDFSLDFDRHNSLTSTTAPGPDFTVQSVTVNGQPATFKFVQPTYPGDPNGQDDPDPLAHRTGLTTPINAANPNPPACPPTSSAAGGAEPAVRRHQARDHAAAPIPSGTDFTVTVNYTGRPGVRPSPTGTEGWFRNATRRAARARWSPPSRPARGLDAAQQPPVGQADLRHLRHGHQGQAGDRPRPPGQLRRQRGRRELPGRLDELPLEVVGADRELPGREQRRQLRLLVPRRLGRRRLLRGPGRGDRPRRARRSTRSRWTSRRPSPTSRSSSAGRSRSTPTASSSPCRGRASRRRCRPRSCSWAARSAAPRAPTSAPSRTRTCTSGGATTSPRARPS